MSHFLQRPLSSAWDTVKAFLQPSTAAIGSVTQASGGSSGQPWWVATTSLGTTGAIGSVALLAGSSANTVGAIAQGAGSTSVAPWYVISTASGGAGSTAVDATLTSGGSTRIVGTVNVSSGVVLGLGSSANILGAIAQGAGSTTVSPWYVISTASAGAGSTTVDAQASSVGSTKLFGQVTVANPTTAVTVSSGVILSAGSSANTIGSVALVAGTSANVIGSAALVAGSSAATIGAIAQGAGNSTATGPWFVAQIPFSSANTSRTSIATSIDIQIVAASSRRALIIANRSTSQGVACGFSTAAVTTALANVDFFIPASNQIVFGFGFPLYGGPIRAITYTSTTVVATVSVVQFY